MCVYSSISHDMVEYTHIPGVHAIIQNLNILNKTEEAGIRLKMGHDWDTLNKMDFNSFDESLLNQHFNSSWLESKVLSLQRNLTFKSKDYKIYVRSYFFIKSLNQMGWCKIYKVSWSCPTFSLLPTSLNGHQGCACIRAYLMIWSNTRTFLVSML